MGLHGYFKASKAKGSIPNATAQPQMSETPPQTLEIPPNSTSVTEDLPSPRASFRDSPDNRSENSSRSSFFEDIKHEVMVNYLHQQQCSHLWVSDGSGRCEGIMLRKARSEYLSCPPKLVDS